MSLPYKSWSGMKKQLEERLADCLKGKITYYFTSYDKCGRAAILYNNKELLKCATADSFKQSDLKYECAYGAEYEKAFNEIYCPAGAITELNFLHYAAVFFNTDVFAALDSENLLLRIFAVLDGRVGKRTLKKLYDEGNYKNLSDSVKQFYELRFKEEGIVP